MAGRTDCMITSTKARGRSKLLVLLQRDRYAEQPRYLPDLIKGDLDSLRPDVRRYYADRVSLALEVSFHRKERDQADSRRASKSSKTRMSTRRI